MLKRKIYATLSEWRKNKKKECLLLTGARQVGKTYIIRAFGEAEYESMVEINFLKYPSLKSIFEGDLDADQILKRITAHMPEVRFVERKTLLFLDEIQRCANARTALKFLAEDSRIDVIASGFLLGLHYGQDADEEVTEVPSFPVGYERQVMMYSLDFEEFLWACGYREDTIAFLQSFYTSREKVPEDLHTQFETLIREYIVVGGMPEAVASFADTHHFGIVQQTQQKILSAYDDDIAKHAKGVEKVKVSACYDSLPRQLARENKKFRYSEVEKGKTAKKYAGSLTWLQDANMVHLCRNVYEPYLPLTGNEKDDEFKLYVNDTGLLMARYGTETKLALLEGKLTGNVKGGIYENLVAEALVKKGYTLHYYKTDYSEAEIEFLIEQHSEVIPIEVKATNASTPSLNRFIERYHPSISYKLVQGNIGWNQGRLTLPHYMILFI